MKLCSFFLILGCLHLSAHSLSQTVTVRVTEQPLKEILSMVKDQTGYTFAFKRGLLEHVEPVTVQASEVPLTDFLGQLFESLPLRYDIEGKTIFITSKPKWLVSHPRVVDKPRQQAISGNVTDTAGNALSGVSITLKGNPEKGTSTDVNGRYMLDVPTDAVLVFSYIGFVSKELPLDGRTVLDVQLESVSEALDEIVVIGYGTIRKSDVTGAISSVGNEELNKFPTANVMQALKGRTAGVDVKQNNGAPGGAISVRIRGANSIVGSNEPLYVVDGFPVSNAEVLNNASIERIEILKDASAVAIYGSRASNGVVLITTKRGQSGTSNISVRSNYGIQRVIKKIDMMNPSEFGLYYNQLYENMGRPSLYSEDDLRRFEAMGNGTNWQDVVFDSAPMQDYSISLSGGNQQTRFAVTGSVLDQEGIIRNSGYGRYSLNSAIQHKFNRALSVDVNLTASRSVNNRKLSSGGRFGTSLIGSAYAIPPIMNVYEEDGSYLEPTRHSNLVSEALFNPLNYINEQDDKSAQNSLLGNLAVSYQITDGLVLKVSGGLESKNARNDFYQTKTFVNNPEGGATVGISEYLSLLNENTLNYNTSFGSRHSLAAVIGFTYQDYLTKGLTGGGSSFLSDITGTDNLATAGVHAIPSTSYSKSILLSGLGRVNYALDGKYLFTASFRSDGSSIYTKGNKWGYFPSAAFAWRISEEAFFEPVGFTDDLKLRASWGRAGSQAISPYSTLNQLFASTTVFGSSLFTTMAPSTSLAADLKWETTDQVNVGLDWALKGGRFSLTVDYYNKITKDLLNAVQLPRSTGYVSSLRNVGQIQNSGFEFLANANVLARGSFTWNVYANISFNRSKVLKLYGGQDILAGELAMIRFTDWGNTYREGQPMGIMYGYVEDGYDEKGYFNYRSREKVKIGDPNPNLIFGLNSEMTYKDFRLSMFFSGTQGNDIINLSAIAYTVDNTFGTNKLKEVFYNTWTPENTNAKYPKPNQEQEYLFSNRYVEDGTYIRLRNIELAYSVPLKSSSRIKGATFAISGQNLLTLTNYSWIDPDVNSRGGSNSLDQGIDFATYPSAKSVMLGLTLDF